ncbi:MAG: hypothetical protein ACD_17C00162G0002 [uncultured bacterium]|nr:MAG: hypothetical protein ACD_17C00162G0002 [uncultured bacterium]OGN56050.1 MAG: hypothetical protein A2796_05615 [Chlamydiae bacterium RIFCSPHIGHO2_01_FULL_44_39]OGN59137.1 MAG: hypothetical protein A3C42_03865 [Chlamydiae bacterium RIFCSPHIGHO2_02_FULL_45_9]OGN60896.1 MAG: hypothetical protein A3D96_01780 [Chlamydiae bacterium RIFCSPHIGHO2_12_FULL_44_59]OGN66482.1 MAG: hypothetical protein A2978_01400 [Chlamydiae bacterium RIFCSPLOWO2_01_FULL_44_52]OGN69945.1 MAG: hypothetical protein A3
MSACDILIDRLKNGAVEKIAQELDSSLLGPDEEDLKFSFPVNVLGEAYLTDDHLIIHLKVETKIFMPCAICNQMVSADLKVDHLYQAIPIEEIPSAVFDYKQLLREALLLELPKTVECNQGKCPERELVEPYLRKDWDKVNFPFADMDKNTND